MYRGGEPERIWNPKGLEAVGDLEPGIWSLNSRARRIRTQNLGLRDGTEPKLYRLEGGGTTGDLGFGMDLEPGIWSLNSRTSRELHPELGAQGWN